MKTKILKLMIACILGLILNTQMNAQVSCPYTIINNLNCPIVVMYDLLDANCLSVCSGANSVVIPANTPATIGTACCGQGFYEIQLYVSDINGTPITTSPNSPGAIVYSTNCGTTGSGGNCSNTCDSGGAGVWTITVTNSNCTIQ